MMGTLSVTRWVVFAVVLLPFLTGSMQAQPGSLSTGIEGVISISPTHGGPARLGETDSAPLANVAFEVVNDAVVVTSFTTDAARHFRVPLPPAPDSRHPRGKKKHGGRRRFPTQLNPK